MLIDENKSVLEKNSDYLMEWFVKSSHDSSLGKSNGNIKKDGEILELNVRKRHKRRNPEEWKDYINKKNRLDDRAYFGKKSCEWLYNVQKNPRKLKKPCNYKRKTKNEGKIKCLDIFEIERQKLFKSYWALDNEDARLQIF